MKKETCLSKHLIKIGLSSALIIGVSSNLYAAESSDIERSVTVSGIIDTGLMSVNHVGDGTQSRLSAVDSILGVSNVGFKGKEGLGNGLNVIYQLQAGFNPSTGSMSSQGKLFSRNSYVGVESSYGTLTVGKQWNFNDDWLVGSVFKGGYNSGAIFKFSEFDAVSEIYNSTIKYVTSDFGGLQGGLMYSAGGNAGNISAGNIFNIALKYAQGPYMLAASYDQEKDGAAVNNTGNLYKLATIGGSYAFESARVRLGYANSNIGGPGSFQSIPSLTARKANVFELGLDYDVTPAFTTSADFLHRNNTTLSNSTNVYRLLGEYRVSSRTSLIANLAYLSNAGGASESLVNTNSTAAGGGFANQTQTGLAVGIRHAF